MKRKHGPTAVILTAENILTFTRREGDCLVWTGARTPFGYGQLGWRYRGVHRRSFEVFKGPIPSGKCICHSCDNPPCINPDHLWIGSPSDNIADMYSKGRSRFGGLANTTLSDAQVIALRNEIGQFLTQLAKKYKISRSAVANIRKYRRRKNATKADTVTL